MLHEHTYFKMKRQYKIMNVLEKSSVNVVAVVIVVIVIGIIIVIINT